MHTNKEPTALYALLQKETYPPVICDIQRTDYPINGALNMFSTNQCEYICQTNGEGVRRDKHIFNKKNACQAYFLQLFLYWVVSGTRRSLTSCFTNRM